MAIKIRSKKLFLNVRDDLFDNRRQSSIVTLLTDGKELYSNNYGKMFTLDEIGDFDIIKVGDQGVLEFYPVDGRLNDYTYGFFSYDTKQNILNYSNYDLGNIISIASTHCNIGIGSSKIVHTIPEIYNSVKLIIEHSTTNSKEYEYQEINVVTNQLDYDYNEYGRITLSNNSQLNQVGIGTYELIQSGTDLNLVFHSNLSDTIETNIVSVSIANTDYIAEGSKNLKYTDVQSINVSIAASTSPNPALLTSYDATYTLGYFIVQVTDITNNEIQLSELLVLNNETTSSIIEYGNVYTNNSLGVFEANSTSVTELLFTPNPDIEVNVKLLNHTLTFLERSNLPISLNFNNAELTSGVSKFESSSINFKKDFILTHKNIPIFERVFDGSLEATSTNPSSVNLNKNLIYIPNHFFVSGEKIKYRSDPFDYINVLVTQTSTTAGIGTDILEVNSVLGLKTNDYFNFNGDYIRILNINSNKVSLANTIGSQINSGENTTFSRLFPVDSETSSTIGAIGIGETYIIGVGNTDKLSGELYIYKYDNNYIGFCTAPIDALLKEPKLINLNSVGIGRFHYITAINQNAKALILIDNVIQSPIVSTSITSILLNSLETSDNVLEFSGITSFFSNDLIKIDNEIMKIESVGLGQTENLIVVQRPLMGTGLATHASNSLITKIKGNYNIANNTIYFAQAPYGPVFDEVKGDVNIRSSFQGRTFMRSGNNSINEETYIKNYVFDDISSEFNSIDNIFELKKEGQSLVGISTLNSISLINSIFQSPENDYNLSENLSKTNLNFTGAATSISYDPNNASLPRGGIIVSVGSSNGFGYQPLVAAGGTAIVSIAGTIESISIGNSGSGYRKDIQTTVRVGVQTLSSDIPNIEYIGIASISNGNIVSVAITNPGVGYTYTNPPIVVFDSPLSYSNLNLIYKNPITGLGTEAKIDVVVGQGSSIIDFTIKNYGYSYNIGDILTIESGGNIGIPTDTNKPFSPFTLKVERTFTDEFSGWTVGELQKLDDIDNLFNGTRKVFPISDNGNRFSIIAKKGSNINVEAVLLIFINDVLQEPGVAYKFKGGSYIKFTEAPTKGSKCRILFYRGTPGIDVVDVDILETIKEGDLVRITSDVYELNEKERLVRSVLLPDTIETSPYNSIGITSDLTLLRPLTWCKQKEDIVVDGVSVGKDRIIYEPNIVPVSYLIQSVGIGSTQLFVDSVKTMFDSKNENATNTIKNKIQIIDNTEVFTAFATAIVSMAGTISYIDIIEPGLGYSNIPMVSIESPIGIGTLGRAELSAQITSGIVTSITIDNPGFGYTYTNPPLVIIESPTFKKETIDNITYSGDFGFITGIKTTSVGFASTGLIFDLYIPNDSYLKNSLVCNPVINLSTIKENYYFKVSNSKVGYGLTSLRKDGSIIGIGTTGIDNIYQVISVSSGTTSVYGVGTTSVISVTVSVSDYNSLSGLGYSSYYGDYSWGLIEITGITNQFNVNSNYGVVGLNSTPIVRRYNPLRFYNYTDT